MGTRGRDAVAVENPTQGLCAAADRHDTANRVDERAALHCEVTAETPADDEHRCGTEGAHGVRHRDERFANRERFVGAGTVAGQFHRKYLMPVSLEDLALCCPLGTRAAESVHENYGGAHFSMLTVLPVVIA